MTEKNPATIERMVGETFHALETMLDHQAEEIRRLTEENGRLHTERLEFLRTWTARFVRRSPE
jgi:ABC-type nitrate/sulfonate/bicarbonate transport system substrate-binding protein